MFCLCQIGSDCQLWQGHDRGRCWSLLEGKLSQQASPGCRWGGWWSRWRWGSPANPYTTSQSGFQPQWTQDKQPKSKESLLPWSGRKILEREKAPKKLTPAEDIWVRPCMVDVSRNSLKISIAIQWDGLTQQSKLSWTTYLHLTLSHIIYSVFNDN